MALPEFDSNGDLPAGVHQASIEEIVQRFGHGTRQREVVTTRLRRVYEVAQSTGKLERFIIFGSYVTAKANPNDVDVLLVMSPQFRYSEYGEETAPLLITCARKRNSALASSVSEPRPFCWKRLMNS
jgi:predicted nucleotidyltransferase